MVALPAWLPAALHASKRLQQESIFTVADELGKLARENLPPENEAARRRGQRRWWGGNDAGPVDRNDRNRQ